MLNALILKLGALAGLVFGWVFISSKYEKRPLSGTLHTFEIGCERLLAALVKRETLMQEETETH